MSNEMPYTVEFLKIFYCCFLFEGKRKLVRGENGHVKSNILTAKSHVGKLFVFHHWDLL